MLIILFFAFNFSCYIFILFSNKENQKSSEKFFKKAPDLIVIFTGDSGRIPFGLKQAQNYNQKNILITGVYSKNTVKSILTPIKNIPDIDPNYLTIDYLARNTVENTISTFHFLKQKPGFKNILIISHDYHIMRIKIITNRLGQMHDPTDQYNFFYHGITTDYLKSRNIKLLYKEVFKLIKAYMFLLFWDTDYYLERKV